LLSPWFLGDDVGFTLSSETQWPMPCPPADSETHESSPQFQRPELLSPAGDHECVTAAIENGADAIYFGLQGHNARARAHNFTLEELPALMARLHRRGVRGYVTLNTLVFPRELPAIEDWIRQIATAGVDAVIVQDVGLTRLIRATAPDLEIHASTQMSVTSAAGVEMAKSLGCSRVILARELSLKEIASVLKEPILPVEVFVHGALCVAYSGQCLTSETLGGRSANRGECAQACRMPYQIVCDGKDVDLDQLQYLLSPQDLAAFNLVPQLVAMGVASLKIEGRLKTPEYVATVTRHYREAIERAAAGANAPVEPESVYEMEMTFSRGFSSGFLEGNDHKKLVRGDYAKKRGVFLGTVKAIRGQRVSIDLAGPVKPGDGVVFDGEEARHVPEQGGRVYEIAPGQDGGPSQLGFGSRDLEVDRLVPGQRVWKTDDPALTKRLRQTFEGAPKRKLALDIELQATPGEPLVLIGTAAGRTKRLRGTESLPIATNHVATPDSLRTQLDRFGGTSFRLAKFNAQISGQPLVPSSLLNSLRRELIEVLDAELAAPNPIRLAPEATYREFQSRIAAKRSAEPACGPVELAVLCRTTEQVIAARRVGIERIYLEYQDIKKYGEAIDAARAGNHSSEVWIATPRIEKPGEANLFAYLAKQGADGLLVRNAGGLRYCVDRVIPFVADFALNAANELSVDWLIEQGARRVTASYDLSASQLVDLIQPIPPSWLEVVIHQQVPMFHMEHCVFCAFLSPGNDHTNCGRPCDHHEVRLRDRVGMEHPLTADVGCRNTLYNAIPQSAGEFLPRLLEVGARHFRVEFLRDDAQSVERILRLYRDAFANRHDTRTLFRELKASSQYGVTRGPLAVIG
jgi:U32 family peptidase